MIETDGTAEPKVPTFWRAFLLYTGSRIAVFAVLLGLLYGVGVRGLVVIFISLVLSGVLSYFLLDRQRAAFAAAVEARVETRRGKTSARTAREDEIADALIAEAGADAGSGQGLPSGGSRGR